MLFEILRNFDSCIFFAHLLNQIGYDVLINFKILEKHHPEQKSIGVFGNFLATMRVVGYLKHYILIVFHMLYFFSTW